MDNKAKFLKTYANTPVSFRNEIVVVVGDQSLTWNVAKVEIENDTRLGKKVLEKLFNMEIIK